MGTFFAVVSGSIIHGLGHFYAADYGTAAGLFIAEIFGVAFAVGGKGGGINEHAPAAIPTKAIIGAILFAFSWIYDIAATPSAVERYNDRQWQKRINISIKPDQINNEKAWLLGVSLKL